MTKFPLILCFWCLLSWGAYAQRHISDPTPAMTDTVVVMEDEESGAYLKEGYYDSIPRVRPFDGDLPMVFEDMAVRYQSADFSYAESVVHRLSFLDRVMGRFWRLISEFFPENSWLSGKILDNVLVILGIVLFAYVIYRLWIGNHQIYKHLKKDKDGEEEGELSYVERNLMDVDVQKYIQEAVVKGDYALAVRYQQLLNIQTLNRKSLIEWEHTKTNAELMEGVSSEAMKADFLACSAVFDRVWFGNSVIDADSYQEYQGHFEAFRRKWS